MKIIGYPIPDRRVEGILHEYRIANRHGANNFCIRVRLCNADLTEKFNEIDRGYDIQDDTQAA